jgi:heme-degrading monooxygenase HmoA
MFAVILEVHPRPESWDDYLAHAAMLRPELLAIDGFIANERYKSLTRPGWLVSLSIWHNEKALIRWRTHALHHDIQGKGRAGVFLDYHLRVGEVVTDTESPIPLPQSRFDATEAGAAKAVTLTEWPLDTAPVPDPAGADTFDSITRPGNGLTIRSFPDLPAAEAAPPTRLDRHRVVRIIRDYGMFARTEAPQYFPPVTAQP